MQKEAYLGRQPVLDRGGNLFAYELLYRNPNDENTIRNSALCTGAVAFNLLNRFGLGEIVGEHLAILKVDPVFLSQDAALSIPREKVIFALIADGPLRRSSIERIEYLCKEGYRFALNDTGFDEQSMQWAEPIAQSLSYLKIDCLMADCAAIRQTVEWAQEHGIKVIASKVESKAIHQEALDAGVEYFQGFFFAEPELHVQESMTAEQTTVMKIWQQIVADTSLRSISDEFEKSPTLALQLLKYVNSASLSFSTPVKSVEQILALMGRMPLMKWLLLFIHSKNMSSEGETALQLLVLNRIETMIGLSKLMKRDAPIHSEVYFVGLLSFVEVLMGIPLHQVLQQLQAEPHVVDAVVAQKGVLGDLLMAARAIEHFDTDAIDIFLERYGIEMDDIVTLTLKTMEKVNSYESML